MLYANPCVASAQCVSILGLGRRAAEAGERLAKPRICDPGNSVIDAIGSAIGKRAPPRLMLTIIPASRSLKRAVPDDEEVCQFAKLGTSGMTLAGAGGLEQCQPSFPGLRPGLNSGTSHSGLQGRRDARLRLASSWPSRAR